MGNSEVGHMNLGAAELSIKTLKINIAVREGFLAKVELINFSVR